jgi:hypothetical protein
MLSGFRGCRGVCQPTALNLRHRNKQRLNLQEPARQPYLPNTALQDAVMVFFNGYRIVTGPFLPPTPPATL